MLLLDPGLAIGMLVVGDTGRESPLSRGCVLLFGFRSGPPPAPAPAPPPDVLPPASERPLGYLLKSSLDVRVLSEPPGPRLAAALLEAEVRLLVLAAE